MPDDDSSESVTFNHVGLCVRDVDVARRFYEELLGFGFLRSLAPPDSMTAPLLGLPAPLGLEAVYLQRDGFVLELLRYGDHEAGATRSRPMDEPGLTHISLTVRDLPGVLARVPDYGGTVMSDMVIEGVAIFVRDPDGQLIELLSAR